MKRLILLLTGFCLFAPNAGTAQNDLQTNETPGLMYNKGLSFYCEKNYVEALVWLRKSADQNYAPAQNFLGYMYKNGYGVQQDDNEALVWYRKSAGQGNDAAQYNLGYMYLYGNGVIKNYNEAAGWLLKSAGKVKPASQLYLADIISKLFFKK